MLTKPNIQFLSLGAGGLLTWALLRKIKIFPRNSRLIALFWLSMGLCLLPWLWRNYRITSRWMLSSAFAENTARVAAVATQAKILNVPVEPWTSTWEYIYETLETQVALQNGWFFWSTSRFNCSASLYQKTQLTQAARTMVIHNLPLYGKAHLTGILKSLLDPGHRMWYTALTNELWSSTGVVADIWSRVLWSFQRGAVWDALQAFTNQRITQIPPLAGVVWWGLWAGRLAIWVLVIRGLWRIRQHPLVLCLVMGVIVYVLLLPGPIAHDRFYVPAVPVVTALTAIGLLRS